jgi:hypothetical protein
MIKNINSNSEHITVSDTNLPTYINSFNGMQGVGNLRFNTTSQTMEVYDGTSWITLYSGTTFIDLSFRTKEILQWAEKKMQEEARLDDQCKQFPGLAKARENFEVFKSMVDSKESK